MHAEDIGGREGDLERYEHAVVEAARQARRPQEFGHLFRQYGSASALDNVPLIRSEHRVWYNPNQKDAWFMPLSELLVVITIMLPAAAVREKERGTIEQLLVTPLSSLQILLPKVVAMTLVILLGTAASLALVLHGAFDFPMKGSVVLFFAVTALYAFTTAGCRESAVN